MAVRAGRETKKAVLLGALLSFGAYSGNAVAQDSMPPSSGAQGARWMDGVITLNVEPSMDALGESSLEALIQAVSAWQTLPALLPTMVVERGNAQEIGYHPKQQNFNTVRYAAGGDPMAKGALAITIITFDTDAKQILDADIIVNGEHQFGILTEGQTTAGTYDLQNVLTHELGHLLGLGEDFDNKHATMYAYSLPSETEKRDLDEPDVASVSELYDVLPPPDSALAGCGGATVSRNRAGSGAWISGLAAVAVAAGAARRRAWRRPGLLSLGAMLALLGAPIEPAVSVAEVALEPSAEVAVHEAATLDAVRDVAATVIGSETHFEDGLIVTSLRLDGPACAGNDEICRTTELDVLGGRVERLEQVVGHALPPALGSRVILNAGDYARDDAALVRTRDGNLLRLTSVNVTASSVAGHRN